MELVGMSREKVDTVVLDSTVALSMFSLSMLMFHHLLALLANLYRCRRVGERGVHMVAVGTEFEIGIRF